MEGTHTNGTEVRIKRRPRAPSRAKRPRSAINQLFVGGDENSAWSRRFSDLIVGHVEDLGGAEDLSEAQISVIKRCASIEAELERLDAMLSRGETIDLDAYARVSGHLRRLLETLHTVNLGRHAKDVSPLALLAQPFDEAAE